MGVLDCPGSSFGLTADVDVALGGASTCAASFLELDGINRRGNAAKTRAYNASSTASNKNPSHQAPTQRGSVDLKSVG